MQKNIILILFLLIFQSFNAFSEQAKKTILIIKSSPFGNKSVSRAIGNDLVFAIKSKNPNYIFTEIDLDKIDIKPLASDEITAFYTPVNNQTAKVKKAIKQSDELTKKFLESDVIIIESPMHNFSISANLKCFIDKIVRPGLTFKVNSNGSYEGLVKNKKMIIISSRGGDYSKEMKSYDFQNPYLMSIFGFLGIKDIQVIVSEGIYEKDSAKRVQIAAEKAKTQVQEIASNL